LSLNGQKTPVGTANHGVGVKNLKLVWGRWYVCFKQRQPGCLTVPLTIFSNTTMKKSAAAAKFAFTKTTVTRFSKKQTPGIFGDALSTSIIMPSGSV